MTKKEIADPYLDLYLDGVWEDYCTSGNPIYLAKYIEEGGVIEADDPLRKYLADLIRERAPRPRGNTDPIRDVDVYMNVQWWRTTYRYRDQQRKKRPSLQEAFRHFTEDDREANIETYQKQYERGRKIMKPKNKE